MALSGAYGDIRDEYDGRSANITPAYLRIEKPWVYSGDVDNWNYIEDLKLAIANSFDDGTFPLTSEQWADGVQKYGTVESPFIKRRYVSTPEQVRKILENYGVDGVIYDNNKEGVGKSYIVFNPTQVKSSIGNNGQFDRTNPDIRKSTSRIIGASTRPYSQDHTDFFRRVGRTIDEPSFLEKLGAMRKRLREEDGDRYCRSVPRPEGSRPGWYAGIHAVSPV